MTPNDEYLAARRIADRPLVLFDGQCGFCRSWAEHWRATTRGKVDFAPAQEEASSFPQLTEKDWKRSMPLLTPEGAVYDGAEAVFRTLAYVPEHRWMLAAYRHLPGARSASEVAYRVVADH